MNTVMLEQWKDIHGYEGLYQISSLGRVISLIGWDGHGYVYRKKLLKPSNTSTGYKKIELVKFGTKKSHKIHRLVGKAFIYNPQCKPNINHKDGNPLNNHVSNLEWCTQSENIKHAYETGLRYSKKIEKYKLKEMYLNERLTVDEIAEKFNTTEHVIRNNIAEFGFHRKKQNVYGIKKEILEKQLKTMKLIDIAKLYGCDASLISKYKKRLREKGEIYA